MDKKISKNLAGLYYLDQRMANSVLDIAFPPLEFGSVGGAFALAFQIVGVRKEFFGA